MSALSESISQRMTLGYLRSRYGLKLVPNYAEEVTITSFVDDLASVRPGSLYLPFLRDIDTKTDQLRLAITEGSQGISDDTESSHTAETDLGDSRDAIDSMPGAEDVSNILRQAELRGAYAVLLPPEIAKRYSGELSIPALVGDLDAAKLGQVLSKAAGDPSASLAVFALVGEDTSAAAEQLADFLHTLGNPVGLLSKHKLTSLDRSLDMEVPLNMFDVQRALSVCLEDGAAAVVIAVDSASMQADALQGVHIDVLGVPAGQEQHSRAIGPVGRLHEMRHNRLNSVARHYGFALSSQLQVAHPSDMTDEIARQTMHSDDPSQTEELSLNIAMTMAAGVKRSHIRSALEASQELT